MATNEEIFRFTYEQRGDQSIVESKQKIVDLKAEADRLKVQFQQGLATHDYYVTTIKQIASESAKAKTDVEGLEKAAKAAAGGFSGQAGMANGVQGASRALQDFVSASKSGGFTAGLNAITNNAEQVALGFGKMAGMSATMASALASGATFAIVGLQLAIAAFGPTVMKWIDDMGLFKGAADNNSTAIERLKTRIDELNEKKVKLQVDRNELAAAEADMKRIKDSIADYQKLLGLKSSHETESEAANKKLLAEAPGGVTAVRQKMESKMVADAMARAEQVIDEEIGKIKTELKDPVVQDNAGYKQELLDQIEDLQKKKSKAREDAAEGEKRHVGSILMGEAPAGQVEAKTETKAQALEEAGMGDLAAQVRANKPSNIKTRAEQKEAKEAEKAHEKAAKEDAKLLADQEKERVRNKRSNDKDEHDQIKDEIDDAAKAVKAKNKAAKDKQGNLDQIAAHQAQATKANTAFISGKSDLDERTEAFLNKQAIGRAMIDASGDNAITRRRTARDNKIFTPETAEAIARADIMRNLQGTKDAKGNDLSRSDIRQIANEMINKAKQDLAAKQAAQSQMSRMQFQQTGQGLSLIQQGLNIDNELISRMNSADQKIADLQGQSHATGRRLAQPRRPTNRNVR